MANRRYQYISCGEDESGSIGEAGTNKDAVVVVDNLQLVKSTQQRGEILNLTAQKEIRLILIKQEPASILADASLCKRRVSRDYGSRHESEEEGDCSIFDNAEDFLY